MSRFPRCAPPAGCSLHQQQGSLCSSSLAPCDRGVGPSIYSISPALLAPAWCIGLECGHVYVQEQVTSSSHTARKQPSRAGKKPSQAHADIPIEGGSGPSVRVSEVAPDEAGQNGPPFMSTQDYLEEAEDLLAHPLEPNPLDTQPEVCIIPSSPHTTALTTLCTCSHAVAWLSSLSHHFRRGMKKSAESASWNTSTTSVDPLMNWPSCLG